MTSTKDITQMIMPHCPATEMSILGSILTDDGTFKKTIDSLNSEFFYSPAIKEIVLYMQKHRTNSLHVISDNFNNYRDIIFDSINYSTHTNLDAELSLLKERYTRRELILECANTQNLLRDIDVGINDVFDDHIKKTLTMKKPSKSYQTPKDIIPELIEHLDSRKNGTDCKNGIITGLLDVDNVSGAFQPGELIIIAGRPSMGKSSFATGIVNANSVEKDKSGIIFSLEMSNVLSLSRLLFSNSRVNYSKYNYATKSDMQKIEQSIKMVYDKNIIFDDTPGISLQEITAKSYRVKASLRLDYIIVDHIGLMQTSKSRSRNEEISQISAGLKNIARELEVPVIALSQLSRQVEQRPNKMPTLSDLRDSGAIEQDADKVFMLYREEYYNKKSERIGEADIIVAKNRNGSTSIVPVRFNKQFMSFENLFKQEEEYKAWQDG